MSKAGQHLRLAADACHRLICRSLAIKASPPTYLRAVEQLEGVMLGTLPGQDDPDVQRTLGNLVKIGGEDLEDDERRRRARATVEVLNLKLRARGELDDEQVGTLGRALAAAYQLGQQETTGPLGWDVGFSLADQDAITGMTRAGLFWVGNRYDDGVIDPDVLTEAVSLISRQGLGRAAAGEQLAAVYGQQYDRNAAYFAMLASTMATRSRSFAAMDGMTATGVTTYRYTNPLDERTSEVCERLAREGVVFTVRESVKLRERVLSASSPDEVREISPWPRPGDVEDAMGDLLTPAELQARGIAYPPLHGRCRSSIDVDQELSLAEVLNREEPAGANPVPELVRPPTRVNDWHEQRELFERAQRSAVKDLKAAARRLKDQGLRPAMVGLPDELVTELKQYGLDFGSRYGFLARLKGHRVNGKGAKRHHALPFAGLDKIRQELRRLTPTQAFTRERERLIGRVTEAMAAHRAYHQAYATRWAMAAGDELRDERKRLIKAMTPSLRGSRLGAAEKAVVGDALERALVQYSPAELRLLAVNGEQLRHSTARAYAMSGNHTKPGYVSAPVESLRIYSDPGVPGSTSAAASRGRTVHGMPWTRSGATVSHEVGHRLDGLRGAMANGQSGAGTRWRSGDSSMEGDGLGLVWDRAIFGTYEAQKTGDRRYIPIPGEPSRHGRHAWAGNWINPYEARIYSSSASPTASELDDLARAGPIEWVAMQATYLHDGLSSSMTNQRLAPIRGKLAEHVVDRTTRSRWGEALRLYGPGYRDGLRDAYDDPGKRVAATWLELLADEDNLPNDVEIMRLAVAARVQYGTSTRTLLGPEHPLGRRLKDPTAVDYEALDGVADLAELTRFGANNADEAADHVRDVLDAVHVVDRGGSLEEARARIAELEADRNGSTSVEDDEDTWFDRAIRGEFEDKPEETP